MGVHIEESLPSKKKKERKKERKKYGREPVKQIHCIDKGCNSLSQPYVL